MAPTGTTAELRCSPIGNSPATDRDTHHGQQLPLAATTVDSSAPSDYRPPTDADRKRHLLNLCRQIHDYPKVRVRPDAIKSPKPEDIVDSLLLNLQMLCHTIVDASGRAHCE